MTCRYFDFYGWQECWLAENRMPVLLHDTPECGALNRVPVLCRSGTKGKILENRRCDDAGNY